MNEKIPTHVAIIMDGNGRWAKRRGLPRVLGHKAGIESVREVIKVSKEVGVKYLTLFTFSKENWRRPPDEVDALMELLKRMLKREVEELHRNNVRIKAIGRIEDLPKNVRNGLIEAIKKTEKNTGLTLTLALSYGGRQEIVDAVKRIARDVAEGKIQAEDIEEDLFRSYLYDPELPDPDLLIRTSGELRISNFLLWEIAYTEIYVTPTLWPDFRREEYLKALEDFKKRERRFGGVPVR